MTNANELRRTAAKCRRLAGEITRVTDPTKLRLLELAAELDSEAAARTEAVRQPPSLAPPPSLPGHGDGR
jgi:hypothetical protein